MKFELNHDSKTSPVGQLREFAVEKTCVTFEVNLKDFMVITLGTPIDLVKRVSKNEIDSSGFLAVQKEVVTLNCTMHGLLVSCKVQ